MDGKNPKGVNIKYAKIDAAIEQESYDIAFNEWHDSSLASLQSVEVTGMSRG